MKIEVGCQWVDCFWNLDKECIRESIVIVKIGCDCSCAWYITKTQAELRLNKAKHCVLEIKKDELHPKLMSDGYWHILNGEDDFGYPPIDTKEAAESCIEEIKESNLIAANRHWSSMRI